MPILKMDQMGRIYQTSPDREDGLGFGASPIPVQHGDLTLGNSYIKSQHRYNDELQAEQIKRKKDELQERNLRKQQRLQIAQKRMQENSHLQQLEDENYRHEVNRLALQMGYSCEYAQPLSGNVMSANGQHGHAGMNRDERAIYNHLHGLPQDAAHKISPSEYNQLLHNQAAKEIIYQGAAREHYKKLVEKGHNPRVRHIKDRG